ncbi:MAG: carbohydrate-binding domain-containing protein [Lachnospiraceae bacterium]|nr:carbohydrate-binding domain-containing protein [Lachnospiraceae bacterium]
MAGSKHINLICVIATVLAVLVTVLFMNGEALGIEVIVDADAESYTGSEVFTENDLDGAWDDSSATQITLNGTDAQVSGSGAYVLNGSVYISNAGRYVVSGTLTNGQIVVDAYQSSKVWVELAGADITCEEDAAFRVNQADKVFLTLKEGTVNSLTSGETYSDTALSDNAGGTIFSHDDLTINGSGTLTVTANYKHGIDANDSLVITGGNITVTAVDDGLHANDSVRLTNTELTIDAGDDAIHCDTEIIVESGEIQIPSCHEGLEAPQITVTGGNITIYSEDDGFNANGVGGSGFGFITGNEADGTVESIDSRISISGGNITIISENARDSDGLDSNGDIYISGGRVLVSLSNSGTNSAIDYASESGGVCVITGGTVIACGSYSMAEHFDSSSTQASALYNFSAGAEAGTTFALEDADGKVLLSWEVPCSFSSVNVSSPDMQVGENYTVVIGDQTEEITLTEVSASYGDVQSTGFGGGFNQGGGMQMRGPGGRGGFGNTGSTDSSADSTDTSRGTMPTPPELPEGMEGMTPPELPEGMEGMTPPELPEGMEEGERPELPALPGEASQMTADTTAATETASSGTALSSFGADTWMELGTSAVILILGIGIAMLYQRRR